MTVSLQNHSAQTKGSLDVMVDLASSFMQSHFVKDHRTVACSEASDYSPLRVFYRKKFVAEDRLRRSKDKDKVPVKSKAKD